jgi:adenylate cyclase
MALARRPRFKTELKRYFHDVGAIVARHNGTLIRASDDSTMSYWRYGSSHVPAGEHACLAALEISRRFCPTGNPDRGEFPTRIGLHAGPLVVSGVAVGEARVANLSGDVANTAARLQDLSKTLGTWVLASADVVKGVPGFETRRIGRFRLVGRDEPLDVVELLGPLRQVPAERLEARNLFVSALGLIERGEQETAKIRLVQIVDRYPDDAVPRFLLALLRGDGSNLGRIEEHGVIRMMAK